MRRGFTWVELLGVVAVIALLFFCLCAGVLDFLVQTVVWLGVGWVWYLERVVPRLAPDPAEVAVAAVSLALVTAGVHWFGRWLVPGWRWRWTARGVVLVFLMFVAGTAAVGITHQTGWLVTSPEPILRRSIHPATRIQSQNNLKQIGLAIHNHADADANHLPASTFTPDGRPLHSWQTALLPYIEQDALHKQLRLDRPWNHPDNAGPTAVRVPQYVIPRAETAETPPGTSHYAANVLALGGEKPRRLSDGFPAGLSNTVFAGEATTNPRPWGDPLNWRDPRLGVNRHPAGFAGPFPGGVNVVMGDGSVRFVSDKQAKGLLDGKFDD